LIGYKISSKKLIYDVKVTSIYGRSEPTYKIRVINTRKSNIRGLIFKFMDGDKILNDSLKLSKKEYLKLIPNLKLSTRYKSHYLNVPVPQNKIIPLYSKELSDLVELIDKRQLEYKQATSTQYQHHDTLL